MLCFIFFFSGQLWRLNGTQLTNKANFWKSDDKWVFKTQGSLIYVENTSKNKVLSISDNGVTEMPFVQNDDRQMWKIGEPNREGYFTITNPRTSKSLTANMAKKLFLKGKCQSQLF